MKTLITSMLGAVLLMCGVGAARAVSSTHATRSTETTATTDTSGSLTTTTARRPTPAAPAKKVCPTAFSTSPRHKGSARPWITDTDGAWVCLIRAGTKLTLRFGARSTAPSFLLDAEVSRPPFCRYQPTAPPGTFLCWSARIVAFTQNILGHRPGASSDFTWVAKRGTYSACADAFNTTGTHAQQQYVTVCKTLIVR